MPTFVEQVARTRRQDSRDDANGEAWAAKLSSRQRREKIRERNRLLWIDHFERLVEEFRARAEDYELRARALLEEGMRGSIDA